jgi:hypothetical protein
MADQDDEGPKLAPGTGGDNSNFVQRVGAAAVNDVPSLPITRAVRAVGRRFGLAKAPGEDNSDFPGR